MKHERHSKANTSARKMRRILRVIAGAAAVCLLAAGCSSAANAPTGNNVLAAQAVYPKMSEYPNELSPNFDSDYDKWRSDRQAQLCNVSGYADNLWDFYGGSTRQFLSGAEENRVYSPVNLYMALSMLAEMTDRQSRSEILDLLSAEDMEALRTQAGQVWNANYCDDGAITSLLGNSVWLDSSLDYRQDVLNTLADNYYASGYYGSFGSEEMNAALRSWLNEQTGGLLTDAAENSELTPQAVLAMYSTVLFKGKWSAEFDPRNNDAKLFHAAGGDVSAEFMNCSRYMTYYCGEDFGAVRLSFASDCGMWLILPDEDKSVDDVLAAGEYMELVKSGVAWENSGLYHVNLSVPKFDVASSFDLTDGLNALGITDVFSPDAAEFCLLNGGSSGVYLGKATHSARVKIDEEGCETSAFTEMIAAGAAMPTGDDIDFVLGRPFLFVIDGMDGQPLFVGTVYQPV